MKTFKIEEIPARTYTAIDEIKCDLCGFITRRLWKSDMFDATESEVRLKTGEQYPEGGSGKEITVDICPDCFVSKLIPWVESQGGKPQTKEWDN